MKPASVKMPCTGKNAYRHHTGNSVRQDKTTASADAAQKHSVGAFFPARMSRYRQADASTRALSSWDARTGPMYRLSRRMPSTAHLSKAYMAA